MKKLICVTAATLFSAAAMAGSFVNSDPAVIGDSFGFVEGPVWDSAQQRFLFSDIPNNKTYAYSLNGTLKVFDGDSGYANGLAIDGKGNLWAARHDRKLSFVPPSGEKVVAAATFNGKPLNSPNDLTIKSDDSVWFTDPPFGIQGYGPQKAEEEQPVRGVYRYKDGDFKLMTGELELPNGIAFSNDESVLYVANTADGWVYRFNVGEHGLTGKQRFAKVKAPKESEPMADGVEVDKDGNVYIAGPGGVGVFNGEGRQLDFIAIDAGHVSNIEIGGPDQNLLMVTAYNKVVLFKLK